MNNNNIHNEHKFVMCLRKIIQPAQPPVNIALLVILRVVTLLLLFFTFITLMLAVLLKPWKTEGHNGQYMEIGLWTICRFDTIPSDMNRDSRCFNDFYKKHPGGPWFDSWRFLMVAATVVEGLGFIYICTELARRKNYQWKPWIAISCATSLAGFATFVSIVIFYIKYEFEFVEDEFRLAEMEWTEETGDKEDFLEIIGTPYIMCWCAIVGSFVTSYMSYYTKCEEGLYLDHLKSIQKGRHKTSSNRNGDCRIVLDS